MRDMKETEIGPVPADWATVPLREVTQKKESRDPRKTPGVPFRYVDVSSVSNDTHRVQEWKDLLGNEAPSRARKVIRAGDVLFATVRPYLRNIARVPDQLDNEICSTGFCVIRPWPAEADSHFVFYLVLHDGFVERIVAQQRGSSYPAVSDKVVLGEAIALPPLPEQRRIARVLNAIQSAIAAEDDVITAARELKRSLMHRLFTYGPGREPAATKDTEIGQIPNRWGMTTAGELFEIQLGKMLSSAARRGISPRPYLRNANVQWGRVDLSDLSEMDFSPREMKKFRLRRDDILVCEGGEIGRTALWEEHVAEIYYQKAIHRLRPKRPNVLPRYFMHYMMLIFLVRRARIVDGARSTIAHIPVAKLKALPVAIPPIEDQIAMDRAISAVDRKIAAEQDRKAALQALFKSMLHQLMTGSLRLFGDQYGA